MLFIKIFKIKNTQIDKLEMNGTILKLESQWMGQAAL